MTGTEPGPLELALVEADAVEAEAVEAGERPLSSRIGLAVVWGSLNSILLRLGGFVSGIIAARIIAPRDFGVFAVALTVNAIIINVSALGVTACIVRERGDARDMAPDRRDDRDRVRARCSCSSCSCWRPRLASQLGSAQATWPIRIMSVNVLLAGVYAVPSALLAARSSARAGC